MTLIEILAKNISVLKAAKNVETKDIAQYLGKSTAMVSKYLGGDSYPPIPVLFELSKYFNISIDDLLSQDLSELSLTHLQSYNQSSNIEKVLKEVSDENIESRITDNEDKINKLEMRINSLEQRS